jgi:hypothetical protein
MEINLSPLALARLERLKSALIADESTVIENAINRLYEAEASQNNSPSPTLAEILDRADLLKGLYRCTRNALDQSAAESQSLILEANTDEEAWQKIAILFPDEVKKGFTIEMIEPLKLD